MNNAATLIAEIDATLGMLRKSWLESKSPEETRRWWQMIDKALDERLAVMALRPAKQIPATV
jgi:hypothetical protein